MRMITVMCLAAVLVPLAGPPAVAADEPNEAVSVEYTPYVDGTYPPKGRHYQIFEDYDLDKHKRPILKIGKLTVRAAAAADLKWEDLENAYARSCRSKGADAVINMEYSHDVDEPVEPGDEMWLKSDLIVYTDQDEFGHVGFWYHNNRPEIPGVRVEMVVSGSPAETAGIRPGDIIKGVAGESTGSMNIAGKEDYREAKFRFRAHQEYQFYVERNGQPLLMTVVPLPDQDVYDWNEQFGGL
ncbi:MAG: PDZ domain-containing protein [Candidatus Omnitrophica bacterium]|nr:PDZ domain-containing protein [Candidatus Omnitrophota bacterium]